MRLSIAIVTQLAVLLLVKGAPVASTDQLLLEDTEYWKDLQASGQHVDIRKEEDFTTGAAFDKEMAVESINDIHFLEHEMKGFLEDIGHALDAISPESDLYPLLKGVKGGAGRIEHMFADIVEHIETASQLLNPSTLGGVTGDETIVGATANANVRRLKTTPSHAGSSKGNSNHQQRNNSRGSRFHTDDDNDNDLPPFMHDFGHAYHPNIVHEAIHNGDVSFFQERLERIRHHSFASFSQHGRKLASTLKSKEEQCKQLYECAKDYTLYDLLVFLYIDDIDKDTGKMDDRVEEKTNEIIAPLTQFDDKHLEDKYKTIKDSITTLTATTSFKYDSDVCDDLLAQFHRFAEDESIVEAHWVQGSVNSVCRSPQKFTFLDYKDLAVRFEASGALPLILQELVECAYVLHDNRPMIAPYKKEGFLFEGFKIPTDIKERTDENHGELPHGGESFFKVNGPSFPDGMFEFAGNMPGSPIVDYVYPAFSAEINIDNKSPMQCKNTELIDEYFANAWAKGLPLHVTMTTEVYDVRGKNPDLDKERHQIFTYSDSFLDENCISEFPSNDGIKVLSFPTTGWSAASTNSCHNVGETCDAYKSTISRSFETCTKESCVNGDILAKGIELSIGKTAVGEVCAVSRKVAQAAQADPTTVEGSMPGYCCLDTAMTSKYWGVSFTCAAAEAEESPMECQNKGPWFSHLNADVCKVYDGVWCRNPRDCSDLVSCTQSRSFENNTLDNTTTVPSAFELYIMASPEIKNPQNANQCGNLREYLGFDFDYPDDRVICEEVERLSCSQDFSDLDGLSGLFTADNEDEIGSIKIADARETTQKPFDPTAAMVWRSLNFGLSTALSLLVNIQNSIGAADCSCPVTACFCAGLKTTVYSIATVGKIIIAKSLEISSFTYTQITSKVNGVAAQKWIEDTQYNTRVNNDGLKQIAEVLTKVPKKRVEPSSDLDRLKDPGRGCDGEIDIEDDRFDNNLRSPDECDEDLYRPSLVIPLFGFQLMEPSMYAVSEKKFKNENDALEFLTMQILPTDDCAYTNQLELDMAHVPGTTCGGTSFNVTPRETRCPLVEYSVGNTETFTAYVDGDKPAVSCGFRENSMMLRNMDHLEEDTTIYIDSDSTGLIDVEFFFQIEDNCPDDIQVEVSVESNEYHSDQKPAVIARFRQLGGAQDVKILLAPTSCEETRVDSGICLSDSETPIRFYDIAVKATDFAGNSEMAQCRVVVVPSTHFLSSRRRVAVVPSVRSTGTSSVSLNTKSSKVGKDLHTGPTDLLERIEDSVQRFEFGKETFTWNGS